MTDAEPIGLLHMDSGPDTFWSTGNAAEAAPGVHTPLGWSIWGTLTEQAVVEATVRLGAWPRSRLASAETGERFGGVFFGRYAVNVNTWRAIGDRTPGTSGDAVEEQFLGGLTTGRTSSPVRNRYPIVLGRLPINVMRGPLVVARLRADNYTWWARTAFDSAPRELDDGIVLLRESSERFVPMMRAHVMVTLLAQGLFDQVAQLCRVAGMEGQERSLVSGYGGMEEVDVVSDLWKLSRGTVSEDDFLRRHGYHGRGEGDVSSRSWRENPAPVRSMADAYRRVDSDPVASLGQARQLRDRTERELSKNLSWWRSPLLIATLELARRFVLGREVGKAGFLMAMDGMRASARSIGRVLCDRGLLEDPEHVFFLTLEELLRGDHAASASSVPERLEAHQRYLKLDLPSYWRGDPIPVEISEHTLRESGPAAVRGLGVCAGEVTGSVKVVQEAESEQADEFEPGDVLVCRTTDPSWAPMLSIAAAVVIDIGGAMSHGAIVARELGIPCVINTGNGSKVLRTGDVVTVDGSSGTVHRVTNAGG